MSTRHVRRAGFLERADPCTSGLGIVAIFGAISCVDAMYCLLAQALFIAAWFDREVML